ncbi:hypothetical protein [Microbacterium marinilacus]|uniref:Transposase n=1 Tax=Microbacterium marinilacus TaxID=415209 RepID=A0ABP7B270_9MICO|nr:hypothetical protein [Microbacterium marinilacus]MBY0688670.1 hypothetical protein [Microbacterium marinilacus]
MAAGGPGDHWLTDILNWDLDPVTHRVSVLVREIVAYGGRRELDDGTPLARSFARLGLTWRSRPDGEAQAAELERALQARRDALRAEAVANGWDV